MKISTCDFVLHIFSIVLDIEISQNRLLQNTIIIINKSTFFTNIDKMLHLGGDVFREISMQHESEMQQNENFNKMMNVMTMSMTSKMMENM